jgi:hypothetical protein
LLLVGLGFLIPTAGDRRRSQVDAHLVLEVEQLTPREPVPPYVKTACRYRVRHAGTIPLRGLEVGAACACQVEVGLPTVLEPGAEVEVRLRVPAPAAGRLHRVIPIVNPATQNPVGWLPVEFATNFQGPAILHAESLIDRTLIAGERTNVESVWETVERRDGPVWFTGLEVQLGSDSIPAELKMTERAAEDAELVYRRYQAKAWMPALEAGVHRGVWRMAVSLTDIAPTPCRIEVKPAISVIPERLTLPLGATRIFTVIDRRGDSRVTADWDPARLTVNQLTGETDRPRRYEIAWRSDIPKGSTAEIRLTTATGQSQSVVVTHANHETSP